MRRFVTLAVLLLFTIPFGVSISGCSKKTTIVYCNGGDTGPIVGQVSAITLLPRIYGISLNQGQIGQVSTPTATDCKGSAVSVNSFTYGVFDANGKATLNIADVVPSGANAGRLCAGTWNRNTGGGIPDYTTCNETGNSGEVYVVASGSGANSNPLPIFIHPKVTSVILGNPTLSSACAANGDAVDAADQSSNCCPLSRQATVTADPYVGNACVSQGKTAQLVARAYDVNGKNITCQVGHLTFAAQTGAVVTIDENGIATAQQPGSTVISANLSQAGSSAGFYSTCPPVSIALTVPNTSNGVTSVVVNQNNPQPLSAVAKDINGTILTGLALDFVSTTPRTIPVATTGVVTPSFPGAASITAICQPPNCNPSPINQVGLFNNGKPVASNPVKVTTPGANTSQLWIASTQSRYILPIDFTNITTPAPVRLPYAPNSMVISNDGSTIYMGTATEIMIFNATTNSLSKEDTLIAGQVLAISPDGTTVVVSDPRKQLTYLYTSAGVISSTYGGVGTRAEFTQDNQTVYITMGTVDSSGNVTPNNQMLVHSNFTGWNQITLGAPATDVAVTIPGVGAYLAGASTIGRSYCPSTTIVGTPPAVTSISNEYYPLADTATVPTDRVIATNDGLHIIGATVSGGASIVDLGFKTGGLPISACPTIVAPNYFTLNRATLNSVALGVTANAITGVIPTSDSATAFVTYTGTGSLLPAYAPATGVLTKIALSGGATAPVAGTISSDNNTVFVGTSGDNQVHLINGSTLKDDSTKTINPKLQQFLNGTDNPAVFVTPNLLVQNPRKTTS
jgi:trimeric autotransporter adhesin